jgi:site-specific DNA recombinase
MVREYHLERERMLRESADPPGRGSSGGCARRRRPSVGWSRRSPTVEGSSPSCADALARKAAERELAERELAELEAPSTIALHPHIADAYRARIERLTAGGVGGDVGRREGGHSRPDRGRVRAAGPAGGREVEIVGSLEAAIALASGAPPPKRGTLSAMLVAGDRFRRNRQRRSIMA